MSHEPTNKAREMEIFEGEFQIAEEAERIAKDESISREDLQAAYQLLAKKYRRLLSQTVKITRTGDSAQSKLKKIQKQLDEQNNELEVANLKLKELDQIKANFTAMLVHDLKSPLSVVKGTLEMFSMDDSIINGYMGELVVSSERSVDKILGLINEVLEVFKSDSQEMKINRIDMDPGPLLTECFVEAQLAARSNRITVHSNFAQALPWISGDAGKLGRVFANLLSNSIKFTPTGGTITLEAFSQEGTGIEAGSTFLVVQITDTGEGIPAEEIPYLFDPYRQAKSTKAKLGVGLGLAIVKRIVAAHGGNITVRSKVGVGTSFTIVLPTILGVDLSNIL